MADRLVETHSEILYQEDRLVITIEREQTNTLAEAIGNTVLPIEDSITLPDILTFPLNESVEEIPPQQFVAIFSHPPESYATNDQARSVVLGSHEEAL